MTQASHAQLGLIGHPVEHSQSPALFKTILARDGREDVTYEAFDLPEVASFPSFVEKRPHLRGLNVTVPHKQGMLSMLTALSPEAEALGAVNTLVRTPQAGKGTTPTSGDFSVPSNPF